MPPRNLYCPSLCATIVPLLVLGWTLVQWARQRQVGERLRQWWRKVRHKEHVRITGYRR